MKGIQLRLNYYSANYVSFIHILYVVLQARPFFLMHTKGALNGSGSQDYFD